jgi:hypothetical protein
MRALSFVEEVGQERVVCSMAVGMRLCYEFIWSLIEEGEEAVVDGRWVSHESREREWLNFSL